MILPATLPVGTAPSGASESASGLGDLNVLDAILLTKDSGHREEALSVKLEVDTRPPSGAVLETSVVRRHVLLRIQHHDRSSLLAGKLHAILQRPYLSQGP